MKNKEFVDSLDFDNLKKNLPDIKAGSASGEDISDAKFFEYDSFMKWYDDYCTEISSVYDCKIHFLESGMDDNVLASVNNPTEADFREGKYHSDISVNWKYLDPEGSDISLVKSFTDPDGNTVKGISAENAFALVTALAHEGRHLEQGKHLVEGTNDKPLNLTMSSLTLASFNGTHYEKHYAKEPYEIDAQNAGLCRGFEVLKTCYPDETHTWFENMKDSMWKDMRYISYTRGEDKSATTVADVNDIMNNSFADSIINYDTSYDKLIESDDIYFLKDDIYNSTYEGRRVAGVPMERNDNLMNKLDENPSYIVFHNNYMLEKIGKLNSDLLGEKRFTVTTDKINNMSDDLNAAAGEKKKIYDGTGEADSKYVDLFKKAKSRVSRLIPWHGISDEGLSSDTYEVQEDKDVNKKLKEITGIDFDAHEKAMKAASVATHDDNYDY